MPGKDPVITIDLPSLKDIPEGPDYEGQDGSRNALGTLAYVMYGKQFKRDNRGHKSGFDLSRYRWNADLYNACSHLRWTIGSLEVAKLENNRIAMFKLAVDRGLIKIKPEDEALAVELGVVSLDLPDYLRRD